MTRGDAPLLMTPGPTRIPDRVLQAGLRVLHHRTPEFSEALAELLERLRSLFGTRQADVLPVHATGRAAMEGAVLNLLIPGDTVVACCNGRFGEMWAGFARRHGMEVVRVASDWERSVDPGEVERALRTHPGTRAVLVAHSDTSTGVLNPVAEIAEVARSKEAMVWADVISSLGGTPVEVDAWGLDLAVTSSQKCLMSSPGIAFVAVGSRAWEAAEGRRAPVAYLDFHAIRGTLERARPETPGTTPVMLMLQVLEAVRMIHEEGTEAVFARHADLADKLRARARDLGFTLQGESLSERSPTLTALCVPHLADRHPRDVDPDALRAAMRRRGIQIAVGLGPHRADAVRVGHMGDVRIDDVEATVEALSESLVEVRRGAGNPR